MIPKTIHYCWFGRNPKPKLAEKCIKSWKKYCPDYDIIEWNEENYDISSSPLYVRQAYEAKKWAFVTDYVRLDIVFREGGIYLDTDVEVIKNLDRFLGNASFFGFEEDCFLATGLGFGAEKGAVILRELMEDYLVIPFLLEDGSYDLTPCPQRNTAVFVQHGLRLDGKEQRLEGNIQIYPKEYFCPKDNRTGLVEITENTYTIHHFDGSWCSEYERVMRKKSRYFLTKYGDSVGYERLKKWKWSHKYRLLILQYGWKWFFSKIREKILGRLIH